MGNKGPSILFRDDGEFLADFRGSVKAEGMKRGKQGEMGVAHRLEREKPQGLKHGLIVLGAFLDPEIEPVVVFLWEDLPNNHIVCLVQFIDRISGVDHN